MPIYSFPEPRRIWGAGCSQSIDMDMGVAGDACVATHASLHRCGAACRETRTPWSARPPDR